MLWRELLDLEPDLLEVETSARTLDPDTPKVMEQIKDRLRPLVGWHRDIPGVEIVPFDGLWPGVRDKKEHDRLTGNNRRRNRFFNKLPLHTRVLYTSEAWDAAVHHLGIVLRTRRRELEPEKMCSTSEAEPPRSSIMDMFGTEEDHGTGFVTVGQLRRALKGKPATAFVYISGEGKDRCPVVEVKYEESEAADEGGVGDFILVGE